MRREDLAGISKEDAVAALVQHSGHAGRAALFLKKRAGELST